MSTEESEKKRRRLNGGSACSAAAVPAEPALAAAPNTAASTTLSAACAKNDRGGGNECDGIYAYREGYRYAVPWWDTWESFVKGKWIGKRLYDTLLLHLPLEASAVQASFTEGAVLIYENQKSKQPKVVDATHVLKQNERIVYRFHRHEPELYCSEVKVLEVTNDFVIVRKPATVPMHPIGRYVLFYMPNINNIQLMQF